MHSLQVMWLHPVILCVIAWHRGQGLLLDEMSRRESTCAFRAWNANHAQDLPGWASPWWKPGQ